MAQTTIQGSFLGDATVTGAKIGADFISAQTALTTGLATTDEIIVSDAGVIKRIDISVWSASTETFTNKSIDLGTNTLTGSVAEFNTALQSESFATLGGTEVLVAKTLTSPVFNTGVSGSAILDEDNLATNSATQLATQQSIKAYADTKAPIAGATLTGTTQFATLSDGTIAVTAWVDEDNMGSNSATLIPTQQSVKAYVDAGGGSITALSGNAENRIPAFGSTTTVLDGDADFTWDGNKLLVGNTTASTKITKGASFDMDGGAGTVMEWRSTGRITHGMTGILDTNTFGAIQFVSGALSPNAGGLMIIGVSHANAGDKSGIGLTAVMRSGEGDNSHTLGQAGSPSGALLIQARQVSGTSWAALDAGENMIVVRNHTTTKYILDADGNTYQTGNVVIGTAGKGIDFSATADTTQGESSPGASMTSELLDDYEEGSWTPGLGDNSSGDGESQAYTSRMGTYTKIGRLVFVSCYMRPSSLGNLTGSQTARIYGLPFNVGADSTHGRPAVAVSGGSFDSLSAGYNVTARFSGGASYIRLLVWNQTTGQAEMSVTQFSADGEIYFSGHYTT